MDRLVGLALIEKSLVCGAVTLTVTVVLWVALPSVPVTVTVYAPVATPLPTFTVKVDELPAVTEVGFRLTVGPDGETLALRLTVPAEPLVTAVLIVDAPLLPWAIERLDGLALIEKSFVPPPPEPTRSRAMFQTSGVPMPDAWS